MSIIRGTIDTMTPFRREFLYMRLCVALFAAAIVFMSCGIAHAGFGITPPYVRNERLTRGSVYEQKILLVRSNPDTELNAEITLNAPGFEDWISIDRGTKFKLPSGETQIPIIVKVVVPKDAPYEKHKGTLRIRTSTDQAPKGGGVSIALGAQIDITLEVVDKIYDFVVRKIRIIDLEEGRRKWGLFFPAKIRFFVSIENTGNTKFGPTKVRFEIYDSEMEQLLETTENTNRLEKIEPFESKEILAELPTRMPAGKYTVKYTIYKNDEVAQENTMTLSISKIGTVPGYEGYGFSGLSLSDKAKVIGVIVIPLLLIALLIGAALWYRRTRSL